MTIFFQLSGCYLLVSIFIFGILIYLNRKKSSYLIMENWRRMDATDAVIISFGWPFWIIIALWSVFWVHFHNVASRIFNGP